MAEKQARTTIDVLAGQKTSGDPVFEEVLVDDLGNDRYRIVATPGLVLNVAADDVVVFDRSKRTVSIESRGRNLAVQVHAPPEVADELVDPIGKLGGVMHGREGPLTVFTVPVAVGFPAVERVLRDLVRRHPEAEWYYGNVYDPADGVTPLNWWT
jgi:hypothetical protein